MEQGKKAKVLCLHGFRTSGNFLKKQISKWHPSIFQQFDMVMPRTQRIWLIGLLSALFCAWTKIFLGFQVFPDGIFPAGGKSEIEGIFPPPYFEWFQNSSSIKYDLQIASDETTEISSYNGILIPDFIFQLQFGHHHNLVCLSYSCQNSSMFDFFSAQEFTEYTNLDECISYLCDYMVKNGPFEGLLGFSQVKWNPMKQLFQSTWELSVLCFCGIWVYLVPEIC